MDARYRRSAEQVRSSIAEGNHDAVAFRLALGDVPTPEWDAWLNLVLGLDDHYADGPELPPGGVPYLPCSVDVLLRVVDQANVQGSDVFVDIGSGPGRATAFVHLLTGAGAIGLEVQPALVDAARELASRLRLSRVASVPGDAATLAGFMTTGSVFFLYCPFSGARLEKVLDDLEDIARTRTIRICCVGVTLPERPWLTRERGGEDLELYRSTWDLARPSPLPSPALAGEGKQLG